MSWAGIAPFIESKGAPFWKTVNVGMAVMPHSCATSCVQPTVSVWSPQSS